LTTTERAAIHDLLCRFFLAFDERDWDSMAGCLAAEMFVDYSSSGRELPSRMRGSDFVARRRGAVDTLAKQHSFSNLLLSLEADGARGRCNYLILRFDRDHSGPGEDFYHSCGSYEFGFSNDDGRWRITSIVQRSLRSWGNAQLHDGSRGA
jgi:hypothetical protein